MIQKNINQLIEIEKDKLKNEFKKMYISNKKIYDPYESGRIDEKKEMIKHFLSFLEQMETELNDKVLYS